MTRRQRSVLIGVLGALGIPALGTGCGQPGGGLRVTPHAAKQGGGEELRIEGSDFTGHGPLVVYLGDRAAKGVVIESPWLVRVVTPQSETLGPQAVRLRFGDGTEQVLEDGFTFEEQVGIVLQKRIGEPNASTPAP